MPRLNKREQKLIIAFAALAVIAILVIVYIQCNKWWVASQAEQQRFTEQINTAEFWLDQKDLYEAKQNWLNENLLMLTNRNEATSEFLSKLQAAAKKYSVEIKQQAIQLPENNEPNIQIRLQLISPIKPFIQWMNEVQKPAEMVAAPEIEVKAIPKSDDLNITVIMVKYFRTETKS